MLILWMLVGSAFAGSPLGPLKPSSIDKAREERIHGEVKGVKAALLAKRGSGKGEIEGAGTRSEMKGKGVDKGSKVHRGHAATVLPVETKAVTSAHGKDSESPTKVPKMAKRGGHEAPTSFPAKAQAILVTHGIKIVDLKELHSASALDLDIHSYRLLLEIGGVGLEISTVEANMDNALEDGLAVYFKTIIGSVVESVSVSLNFLEDSIQSRDGETTGDVEIETKIHLHTTNSSLLVGLDEGYATQVLENYFVGDSVQGLLDAMERTGTTLSFIRLQSNSTNDSDTFTASASTLSLAAAFGGVLAFAAGFGFMRRKFSSTKKNPALEDIDETESEEDQFHPLAPVHAPVQRLSNFRSSTNPYDDVYSDDDEDSLGSDRYLNWPIEREVRSRWKRSSLHDVSVDSDDDSLSRIKG